ncbi:hypothetical protein [Mycolicibacterium palauense]|uniref:hypothetical protein n=1 Tax=Mycolicibacterium palauense TaxID=2034511 RepID=UPI000BFF03C3|nr:hypothetical protein [Mycolicibacterium palauense]
MTDLTTQTPAQIDAILNELGFHRAKLISHADSLRSSAHHARTGRHPDPARAARLDGQADDYAPKIAAITEQMRPYSDEYDRRGGWTRAFLVQNTGGHVHSSMRCSTCFPSTRYAWLTEYSGHHEDQIVYAAGELACTVCYPSAPVEVLTRTGEIRRPTDLEREQRAAEKATKNAAATAAAITDPDTGKTLYKTELAATNAIATALGDLHWYGDDHPSAAEWRRTVDTAVAALAAKHDRTPEAIMAECRERADKKFASTARKTLRELKRQRGGDINVEDLMPGLQTWIAQNGIPA